MSQLIFSYLLGQREIT